jgi:hypothetical protein
MNDWMREWKPDADRETWFYRDDVVRPEHGRTGKMPATARLTPRAQVNQMVLRMSDPETARAFGESLRGSALADPEDAVGRASSSAGQSLPDDVRLQFEGCLGTDLSGVRVHTGDASATAAAAVGARAYAVGQDIHFASGHYDPTGAAGKHLLAHEVAHTVQQAGGAGGAGAQRQHKLEVSEPGDALELEADRAADAMVSGREATIGGAGAGVSRTIMRGPNNSYSAGAGLKWEGSNVEMQAAEMQEWASKKATLVTTVAGYAAKLAGFDGVKDSAVIKAFEAQIKLDVDGRKNYIENLEKQIKDRKKQGKPTDDLEPTLASEKAKLEKLISKTDGPAAKAIEIAKSAASVTGTVTSLGGLVNGQTQTLNPSMFKDMASALEKFNMIVDCVKTASLISEKSTLVAFQANPSFDTAAAWGAHIGATLGAASSLAAGIPYWGPVLSGMMKLPSVVVANFTSLIQSRYAMIDAMTKDTGKSKMLQDGESG